MKSRYTSDVRYRAQNSNDWKECLDAFDKVYMTRDLTKYMLNKVFVLLSHDKSRIRSSKGQLLVSSEYGEITIRNKVNVCHIEYSDDFLANLELYQKEQEELDALLDHFISEYDS